ncbi:MAG: arginase family protein, partial [Trebonia sp.]|uniref:arginase family protein n=1 Tax=Trebonia sp. TaxID=2767075 RepID=UPI003BAE95D5
LPPGDTWARLAALYRQLAGAVSDAVRHGDRPVVVSGDCTTALGTVAGLQHAGIDPGIVWFDAHGDVQTLETTASGYLGGLPLRLLVGYRPELIATDLGLRAGRRRARHAAGNRPGRRSGHCLHMAPWPRRGSGHRPAAESRPGRRRLTAFLEIHGVSGVITTETAWIYLGVAGGGCQS